MTITVVSAIATPVLAQVTTQIGNLQQSLDITISGQVIGFGEADENEWIVADDTGAIVVDAGPKWWHQIDVSMGEKLTIVGQLDEGEFDAFSIVRANGSVINIRPAAGYPPWAGNREEKGR